MTAEATPVMRVHIEIEVDGESMQDWLEAWPEYKDRLIELARIKEAWAEIPAAIARRVELR